MEEPKRRIILDEQSNAQLRKIARNLNHALKIDSIATLSREKLLKEIRRVASYKCTLNPELEIQRKQERLIDKAQQEIAKLQRKNAGLYPKEDVNIDFKVPEEFAQIKQEIAKLKEEDAEAAAAAVKQEPVLPKAPVPEMKQEEPVPQRTPDSDFSVGGNRSRRRRRKQRHTRRRRHLLK